MFKFKNFALPLFAMVATVTLSSSQSALADHDHWRNGHDDHARHSNQVYRNHHNGPYYNNRNNSRYNNRYNNHPRSVRRQVKHVLRHI